MLRPARARSAGGTAVMSRPAKRIVPSVGISAPATHFISVLLPEPLGPMSPWNSFSATVRSTPFNAVSRAKAFLMPWASRSGMLVLFPALLGDPRQRTGRTAERADALALRNHETDQAAGSEEDDQEQQQSQDYRPYLLVVVRQPEADDLDGDDADDRADQRSDAAEQRVQHDLRRQHHSQHVGPHEPLMEGVEAAGEAGDRSCQREHDGLQPLNPIAEEGDARLLLAHPGERQP